MDDREIKGIIEALLFISGEPLSIDRIKNVFASLPSLFSLRSMQALPLSEAKNASTALEEVDRGKIKSLLWELQHEYDMRLSGLRIVEVAGGFQIATRPELSQWIKKLKKVKQSARLSRPSLETLAIIAYRQPIVKAEIEDIRGVDSTGVIKGLLDKRMVKIIGRKDVPGRPILYATTREFLQYFGLRDISDLPTLKELNELVAEEGGDISEVGTGEITT